MILKQIYRHINSEFMKAQQSFQLKKYTLLLRKICLNSQFGFTSFGNHAGAQTDLNATSESHLNQEITILNIELKDEEPKIQLHIFNNLQKDSRQIGRVSFNMYNERILKPLAKQYFSKQFHNEMGYIQYKFINCESKKIDANELQKYSEIKNSLSIRTNQKNINKQEAETLMSYINQKDEIIQSLNKEISRLISQTKKIQKNMARQKQKSLEKDRQILKYSKQKGGINLNVKVNPSSLMIDKQSRAFERQREEYRSKIDQLWNKIHQYENRQEENIHKIQELKKTSNNNKMQSQNKSIRQSNTMKAITPRSSKLYEHKRVSKSSYQLDYQNNQENTVNQDNQVNQVNQYNQYNQYNQDNKSNQYSPNKFNQNTQGIQEKDISDFNQLKQQYNSLKKIRQKQKKVEQQLKNHIKQLQQKLLNKQIINRDRRSSILSRKQTFGAKKSEKDLVIQQQLYESLENYQKQNQNLESQNHILQQKLKSKEDQAAQLQKKLQKTHADIGKIQDQNIKLRKQRTITNQEQPATQNYSKQYSDMITRQRKEINEEKLQTQITSLKQTIRQMQIQHQKAIKEKEYEIMRLGLSEKGAVKEKIIYASRIDEMMNSVDGDRKNYLQALEGAHKFQTMQARANQLEIENKQLQQNNFRLNKDKQEIQNNMKKLKNKIDERDNEWIRLKSVESQHDYYKNQCEKFEKANKKFEKQYQILKEYAQNVESMIGKKPKKATDENVYKQREEKYKQNVRDRLELLVEQTKQMENKYYIQQIQIWLTQRTNIIQYYAKKLQQDKKQINDIDQIQENARKNLTEEKIRENSSLKEQQIEDVDRKIEQLKNTVAKTQGKHKNEISTDTVNWQQKIKEVEEKFSKINENNQLKKKQIVELKKQIQKMHLQFQEVQRTNQLPIKNKRPQAQSLLSQDGSGFFLPMKKSVEGSSDSKVQDIRKSYLDEFRKSKDFLMSKPFEDLKKMNSQLIQEKNKLDLEIRNIRFNHEKQRLDVQDKVKGLERQIIKLEHDIKMSTQKYEKNMGKAAQQNGILKLRSEQMQQVISQFAQELSKTSKQVEMRTKQSQELMTEVKKLNNALDTYEAAEKKLIQDVIKLKQNLSDKEFETQSVLEERNARFLKITKINQTQIEKLKNMLSQMEQKFQKQIYQSLQLKEQMQTVRSKNIQYDQAFKQKQQQYSLLHQNYQYSLEQNNDKIKLLQEQNEALQTNILELADDVRNREIQCQELLLKSDYARKKQASLNKIKEGLEKKIEESNHSIQQLQNLLSNHNSEFDKKNKQFEKLKELVQANAEENQENRIKIMKLETQERQLHDRIHQKQKQIMKAEQQTDKMEIKFENMKERYEDEAMRVKQIEQEKIQEKRHFEDIIKQLEFSRERRSRRRQSKQDPQQPPSARSFRGKSKASLSNIHTSHFARPPALKHVHKEQLSHRDFGQGIKQDSVIQDPNKKESEAGSPDQNLKYQQNNMQLYIRKPVSATKQRISKIDVSKVQIDIDSDEEKEVGERSIMHDIDHEAIAEVQEKYEGLGQSLNPQQFYALIQENDDLKEALEQMLAEKGEFLEKIQGLQNQAKIWKKQCEKDNYQQSHLQHPLDTQKQILSQYPSKFKESLMPSRLSSRDDLKSKKRSSINQDVHILESKQIQLQLAITELELKNKQLEEQLSGQKQNVQKLLVQTQDLIDNLENKQNQLNQLKSSFNNKVSQLEEIIIELQKNLEQLTLQNLKKDETISKTIQIVNNLNQDIQDISLDREGLQSDLQKSNIRVSKLIKQRNNNKTQFRKYEEESELQILRLKQTNQLFEESLKAKKQQLNDLAQKYIALEQTLQLANHKFQRTSQETVKEKNVINQYQKKYNEICVQLKKNEGIKGNLIEKVGRLQQQLNSKDQQIRQFTKSMSLNMKKNQIASEAEKTQHNITRKKLKQREEHISNLKLELNRYNQLCVSQEKDKKQLGGQIQKIQRQLKDIMKTYQNQLDQLSKDKLSKQMELQKYIISTKQSQQKYSVANKQIIRKQKQIKQLGYKIQQFQRQTTKMKQNNRKQVSDLYIQLQMKNNQYQKIKVQLERQSQFYFTKQCQYMTQKQSKQQMETDYKSKLNKYQQMFEEMSKQLKDIGSRPPAEKWEEVCFENQLFKNRVEELEDELRCVTQQQHQKIYSQFRRYKINKQNELQAMQRQLQKYQHKFVDIEENTFILKKDNEALKVQLRNIMQQKIRMQRNLTENEEDIKELKDQLGFYKNKRNQELNKLLNESYD